MGWGILGLPPLAGDWQGRVGIDVQSRWRGYGTVVTSHWDWQVLTTLKDWRILLADQLKVLAQIGDRDRVLERTFRMGLTDKITIGDQVAYALSRQTAPKLKSPVIAWKDNPDRTLRLLAANRLGQVLLRSLGGSWQPEPDAGRTATWTVEGQKFSVLAYRYWPGCEAHATGVLRAVSDRMLVVVPREEDVSGLASLLGNDLEQVRWTWDTAIVPDQGVQFYQWQGGGLVPAETFRVPE